MNSYVGILTEDVAGRWEVTQLAASACGATALVNALLALRLMTQEKIADVDWSVCTLRRRDLSLECALPEYLVSRSVAGCTGQELVDSMERLTNHNGLARVKGKFIAYDSLCGGSVDVIDCLSDLLQSGNAVIGTFNLQILGNDAWHHQLIYGVNKATRMVYCTNPVCQYPAALVESFLNTKSCLVIRREDVIERINRPGGDVTLYQQPLWIQHKVKEQIERLVGDESVRHIVIPANYVGGFAVFS